MIETRLLRQFIAVAEELHFHKAAIRLHRAQPPLSQAIHRLQYKLGFSLFTRNKRGVKLTPAGSAFLSAAYSTLKALELGIEHARQVSEGIAGKLTVTALPISTENVESRLLLDEEIVMALPAHHPKAKEGQIDLRDFAGEDFVFTPEALSTGYHSQLTALCEAAGFYPKVVQEAAQIHTLIGLVACGFGVALVPESIANSIMRDKVLFRRIYPVTASPNPAIGLYMSWSTHNESPLMDSFISMFDLDVAPQVEGMLAARVS